MPLDAPSTGNAIPAAATGPASPPDPDTALGLLKQELLEQGLPSDTIVRNP